MKPTGPLLLLTVFQGLAGGSVLVLAFLVSLLPHQVATPVRAEVLGAALVFAAVGGVSSFFHMHRIQAARYVLRRLKTSWLSREALTTGLFGGALALATALGFIQDWRGGLFVALVWLAAAAGFVAMLVTALLYATIAAMLSWHSPLTVLVLLMVGWLSGGSIALALTAPSQSAVVGTVMLAVIALVALVKGLQWHFFTLARRRVTAKTGAGLPKGPYRLQDTGTTRPPYRTQTQIYYEMDPSARTATILWVVATLMVVPALGLVGWMAAGARWMLAAAALSSVIGALSERWLFFRDATHSSRVWFTDEPHYPSRVATHRFRRPHLRTVSDPDRIGHSG
jgi:DMSO reductase anchor subunit